MTRGDIVLNFITNPDDGTEIADIDEFLDVSYIITFNVRTLVNCFVTTQ